MKLFLIEQSQNQDYDTYDALCVHRSMRAKKEQ